MLQRASGTCAIDFGTSNSAVAVSTAGGVQLARVEGEHTVIPTAVFYDAEPQGRGAAQRARTLFGREAIAAYVSGHDGRLMRSIKSILGSSLMDSLTDIGGGRGRSYADIVGDFIRHLKASAETQFGQRFEHAVIGRPVFFVDDDPARDARAEHALGAIAQSAGFKTVEFQFEPLAAAFDLEQQLLAQGSGEHRVLICDFGGGTCDFSVVRLGGVQRRTGKERILAHHGIHVAGTDFDRHVSLAAIMPLLGHGSTTRAGRAMPSGIYHDLATWHLINTCYTPLRMAEVRQLRADFMDVQAHQRLMTVLDERLGHGLAGLAEDTKVAVATEGMHAINLGAVQAGLQSSFSMADKRIALQGDIARIGAAAQEAVRRAGIQASDVQLLYFTGGSSKLGLLSDHICGLFAQAEPVYGDSFASVAKGLGVMAAQHAPGATGMPIAT